MLISASWLPNSSRRYHWPMSPARSLSVAWLCSAILVVAYVLLYFGGNPYRGFTADPLDLFPKPRCFREAPDASGEPPDILEDLKEFLLGEMPSAPAARFDAEGGFR